MKRALGTAIGIALLCSGCGVVPSLTAVPLPGGPELGESPRTITVETADTLNLAPQATVKVSDVTVGTVAKIERVGWTARLTLKVRRDASIPANSVATIRQTGLLGEKYVELAAPAGARAVGDLPDNATIPVDRAFQGVEVEEVLGALSLLLNGGGLARVQTITRELHKALDGREGQFRVLLDELDTFTTGLDRNRDAIVAAIDGMDRLTRRLDRGRGSIHAALKSIGPALAELADQRKDLVGMFRATGRFADVGGRVMRATREDLVAGLEALDPILARLVEAGDAVPQGLEFLLAFPMAENIESIIYGDYANLDLELNISLDTILHNETGSGPPGTGPGLPDLPELPNLPGLPSIPGLPVPDLPLLQTMLSREGVAE